MALVIAEQHAANPTGPRFPAVTLHDNVACQNRLLTRARRKRIAARAGMVDGRSASLSVGRRARLGGRYPAVLRLGPNLGRTTRSFLEGVKAALMADAAFAGGDYTAPRGGAQGLRAGLRGMGLLADRSIAIAPPSQLGFETWAELLLDWEPTASEWDANAAGQAPHVAAWRHQRQNERYRGDFESATRRDPGARDPGPLLDGSLLPAGGQRHRGQAHAQRRAQALRVALGPLRGSPSRESSGFMRFLDGCVVGAAGGLRRPELTFKPPPARRSGSVAGVTGACVCDGWGLNWLRVG